MSLPDIATDLAASAPILLVFDQQGDFAAIRAAKQHLEALGFSIGRGQRGAPRGVLFGNYDISKWRNMSRRERDELHGAITGDGRTGPLTFRTLPACPPEAIAALFSNVEA